MAIDATPTSTANRRLRLGMVGGGPGGFIGAVHRIAARIDDRFELVAAALSSNPEKSRQAAQDLHIPADRAYGSFAEMAAAESKRSDRIDAVSIVTPNHLHFAPAKAFLDAGIHVICDKPLTTTVDDALALEQIVKKSGLIFGLTHNYTGYPTVRQAREMIAAGELGHLRLVQVEYAQDWLTTPLETTGQKQAVWRTDPAQSGPAGSLGDIGTHAYNIACFVSGLSAEQVAADVSTFVPGRRLDDNVQVLLRYQEGVRGMLWASQVAVGNENNLRLRVYGEKGGLDWSQENPNYLHFSQYGKPTKTLTRNGADATPSAKHASRIPSGHPEGYLEAFAQLYTDIAEQISARQANRPPAKDSLLVPTVADGVAGVQFISAVLGSSKQNAAWVKLPASA
ncbi:MAG: Gfo/Idh/MocA family oxidoreductase [Candidatus Acidiferrum sp.]|jgi:predicted dehydrogenase